MDEISTFFAICSSIAVGVKAVSKICFNNVLALNITLNISEDN